MWTFLNRREWIDEDGNVLKILRQMILRAITSGKKPQNYIMKIGIIIIIAKINYCLKVFV